MLWGNGVMWGNQVVASDRVVHGHICANSTSSYSFKLCKFVAERYGFMVETFVLAVLENVLSRYIGDVLTNRKSERTRAEVIDSVKVQLSRIGDVQKQVDALTIAVRELDFVVKNDKYLSWQGDVLAVEPPRRIVGRKQLDPQAAIKELQASVAQRRRELQQSYPNEDSDAIRVVDVDQGTTTQDGSTTPWQERVVGLQSEIRRERRRAQDK